MSRLHRARARMFSRSGKRSGIELSHSADYWPLTIIPSTSAPKRSLRGWMIVSALVALGAAVALARQQGIPAW